MIDYNALAVSLFALVFAGVCVLGLHALSKRRRRSRKIVADPPLDDDAVWRRAYAESDGDHRAYVDYRREN